MDNPLGDKLGIPRSPLDGILIKGVFGAADGPGVTVSEQRGGALLDLSVGTSVDEMRRIVAARFSVALPIQCGETTTGDDHRALWLGPGHWLIKTAPQPNLEHEWSEAAPDAAVNDVTHGRIVLRITGPRARDTLSKGCPLDLHPSVFPANACAQSLLGKIGVVVDCQNPDDFEIIAGRAYARSLWAWITGAAAEYGYKVE